ncbi:uracil phosphoribosyltransferase [Bacteriovoracaceae bacterium]|nr:uracil phosphoribosyltransferase [Bacteriovoracaceae bacterium]
MDHVTQLEHPILRHKLGYLRDKSTSEVEFRHILKEISQILAYEAIKDYPTEKIDVTSPITSAQVERVIDPPVIVSIMRAGNTMLGAILDFLPFCRAGHIGIYRDKFINNTVEYFFKLPKNVENSEILLCDPMVATGDTMIAAIDRLKNYQVKSIKIITVLISKQSLERIKFFHPDVKVVCLSAEDELMDNGYLSPGIGDAGDRLFGSA